jgi:hypothetical protein
MENVMDDSPAADPMAKLTPQLDEMRNVSV